MPSSLEPLSRARSFPGETPVSAPAEHALQVLRGATAVMAAGPAIMELRERTGQHYNPLLVPEFFIERVRLLPGNQPVVLLVFCDSRLCGAVYLFERVVCGIATGYLRGFDHLTGESSVIASEPRRPWVLRFAIHQLFAQTNARVAWATVSEGVAPPLAGGLLEEGTLRLEASSMLRAHRLRLGPSFDATLGRFGQHTRRNLRYYRRRAEKELRAVFHPRLTSADGVEALQHLGKSSFQPFPASLMHWRKLNRLLSSRPDFFAMGLKSNETWLSYLVGLRAGNLTYVLMQVNHNKFARYSLSTVLRSYFFEHEIERGQAEIKFVNGTCAFFQRCCEPDTCVTVAGRRGWPAFVLSNWIAPWHSAPDHALNIKRWTNEPKVALPRVSSGNDSEELWDQPKG